MTVSYAHEPFTNFQEETNKQSFQEALAYVNSQLGKHYPLIINGEAIETDKRSFPSIRQIKSDRFCIGSRKELAEKAMQAALQAFQTWKKYGRNTARMCCLKRRRSSAEESTNSPRI